MSAVAEYAIDGGVRHLPFKKIRIGSLIDRGGFAKVYHAVVNTKEFALKCYQVAEADMKMIQRDVKALHTLRLIML